MSSKSGTGFVMFVVELSSDLAVQVAGGNSFVHHRGGSCSFEPGNVRIDLVVAVGSGHCIHFGHRIEEQS